MADQIKDRDSEVDAIPPTNDVSPPKQDNPLWDVLFNIFLPVMVLKYVSPTMGSNGPLAALIIGLSLPLGFGLWEYKLKGKRNYISNIRVCKCTSNRWFCTG